MDNRTIEEVRSNETKLIKEIEILEEENQKLKKQLSNDHQIKMKRLQQENRKLKQQISNSHQMENQQKEFIEWLEDKMKETHYTVFEFQAYRLAFEKYKEIIGGNNDQ